MHMPNLKSVALLVPEIIAIRVLGGVVNLQSRERGPAYGIEYGMVPSEERW